jgi:hypothetical protein
LSNFKTSIDAGFLKGDIFSITIGATWSGIPIDKENHVYHIVPYNNLREELIILNYTSASAGTYGCIIGVGKNKTVCTTILEGILLMYSIV